MTSATVRSSTQAMLGMGSVRHRRLRPVEHAFAYPTYFLMLPMRAWRASEKPWSLARNRWGLLSFHDQDHGQGQGDALAWIESVLAEHEVHAAHGEIWLQTYPRVLNYVFKPVSFWYCHDAQGALHAVVVEVNNTFGERHVYVLDAAGQPWGTALQTRKVFHVSPFCRVEGDYTFRFMRTSEPAAERLVARIDHSDDEGLLLMTSLSGELTPLTHATMRRAFFSTPWMTLGVIARIHWQALRLALKRVPFFAKPAPPTSWISR
jgi:uncharacterized protein